MKKIVTLVLCVMLLVTMAVPVFAEEGESTPSSEPTLAHQHSWTESDSATCDQPGVIIRSCSGCNETETVGQSPAKGHSWTQETITNASCTSDGSAKKTCSQCGAVETVTIPKTGHKFGALITTATDHSRVCEYCNISESGQHSWSEESITQKPTCKDTGLKQKSCTICGYCIVTTMEKLADHTYDSACDDACNVCGAERTVSHHFTTTWSKDYKGHWHECTKCGVKKDENKHVPGPEATEEKEQVCQTCGYVIAPKKEHTHSYGREWSSDEVGHWHACTKCREEKDYASHQYDNDCDGECNTCGYKRENSHRYDENWQTTKFEHWNVCTVCAETSKKEKHIPGAEATDEAAQTCTVCGFELAPKLEHTHDFGTIWFQDDLNHWQECACGEQSVPAVHVWDEGRENRNDTITYTCADCGAEKTEAAPSSGFPWLTVLLVILAVGCLGGIGVLVYLLKKGVFDEEEAFDSEEEDAAEEADTAQENVEMEEALEENSGEDPEEKMIDDYFASLGEDTFK